MTEQIDLADSRAKLQKTLRLHGISDDRVLAALVEVPREKFIPSDQWHRAYENNALPIAHGQTISQPYIVALMTQELKLDGRQRVLEIGTGSGYQAAVLSQLARAVYTVERIKELSFAAEVVLDQLGITNVYFRVADGSEGWAEEAPFDRIIVTAAAPDVPPSLIEQLHENGILVMPVGGGDHQSLKAFRKHGRRLFETHLCECRFVPLIGTEAWSES